MSRNCFWDRTWGRAGQLLANFFPLSLVTIPEVFAKVNSTQISARFNSCELIPKKIMTNFWCGPETASYHKKETHNSKPPKLKKKKPLQDNEKYLFHS